MIILMFVMENDEELKEKRKIIADNMKQKH